ncbi:DUF6950 family protein [Pseudooceanicola algae]|uniref:DUF6950 domain-containing protein n=1 Tax=Pseudooceanicola algae TaxID=1537215 RepID=A0A418SDF1_9RHOB|nr:hypothetical protein [Pseudooceanicola algae]QPM89388.1 hypothetical protein PSAL_006040 [Pseudooceanicola algae]
MSADLYGEINRWLPMPFHYGESDCCMVLADWVRRVTGIDVAAEYRLTYTDLGSCQRATGFRADPLRVTTHCMEAVGGFPRTDAPAPGDVAVVRALIDGRVVPFGALRLRDGWASKAEHGACIWRRGDLIEVLRAWSIGYET